MIRPIKIQAKKQVTYRTWNYIYEREEQYVNCPFHNCSDYELWFLMGFFKVCIPVQVHTAF